MKRSLFTAVLYFLLFGANSQITSIPEEAKANFANQYPEATDVVWTNNVINVGVKFDLNGEKMYAEYTNKGIWKETYQDWTLEKLPVAVTDGLDKSKYAEWKIKTVKLVHYPGNIERYRVEVEKNELQKKYLYFNTKGRMVKSSITL